MVHLKDMLALLPLISSFLNIFPKNCLEDDIDWGLPSFPSFFTEEMPRRFLSFLYINIKGKKNLLDEKLNVNIIFIMYVINK